MFDLVAADAVILGAETRRRFFVPRIARFVLQG
jgi:hypothetical protein